MNSIRKFFDYTAVLTLGTAVGYGVEKMTGLNMPDLLTCLSPLIVPLLYGLSRTYTNKEFTLYEKQASFPHDLNEVKTEISKKGNLPFLLEFIAGALIGSGIHDVVNYASSSIIQ